MDEIVMMGDYVLLRPIKNFGKEKNVSIVALSKTDSKETSMFTNVHTGERVCVYKHKLISVKHRDEELFVTKKQNILFTQNGNNVVMSTNFVLCTFDYKPSNPFKSKNKTMCEVIESSVENICVGDIVIYSKNTGFVIYIGKNQRRVFHKEEIIAKYEENNP